MSSKDSTVSVAIIGAGISGLSAAYEITRRARESGRPLVLRVFEASDRVGGVIETVRRDGLTMELGPDSIVTDKPWAAELCKEIGLGDEVIPTRQIGGGAYIARGNELFPVPDGFHLMAPSRLLPFASSRLLSPFGKLRVAADVFIPAARDERDESLADFVRRRLGREALERIAQPMVGGIYTADPEKLSLRATMPRFVEMERKHGSLIRAMIANRRAAGRPGAAADGAKHARGPRYDLFVSLRAGLGELPQRLAALLPDGALRAGCGVARVARENGSWRVETEAEVGPGPDSYDAVCISVPAFAAAAMLSRQAPALAEDLAAIEYASSATINLAYAPEQVGHKLDGFGFVVPAIEGRTTLACTFSSRKYEARSPQDVILLRAFVGGALSPESVFLDDDTMIAAVIRDLRDLLGVRGEPLQQLVTRWPRSMPQYHVGHLARVDRIENGVAALPSLELAGNAYRGTGIPDCVRSGREAAARLFESLRD
jgi:oxygen-dependent protoporphyrinogen oxidase